MLKKSDTAWKTQTLWERILDREPMFVVDVRNPDEFEQWRVEGPEPIPTVNVPYFDLLDPETDETDIAAGLIAGIREKIGDQLPADHQIVAVCAKGDTSGYVAEALRRLDYDAVNLEGGMQAWGEFYYWRPVVEEESMGLYQVVRPARGCLSHVLVSDGHGVVFDPARHAETYRELLDRADARLERVIDTHLHADHLSGGPALAAEAQVPYHLHPYDGIHPMDMVPAEIDYRYLKEGQMFFVGRTAVQALHVPGHTLGMVAFLIDDRYLLTGDSLFLDSIARPDLGGKAETWTPLFHASIQRMMGLPDETVVLPGHFSQVSEGNEDGRFMQTLGELKRHNPGLQKAAGGHEEFERYIMESLPEFPDAYVDIKRINAGLRETDQEEARQLELGKNVCALSG